MQGYNQTAAVITSLFGRHARQRCAPRQHHLAANGVCGCRLWQDRSQSPAAAAGGNRLAGHAAACRVRPARCAPTTLAELARALQHMPGKHTETFNSKHPSIAARRRDTSPTTAQQRAHQEQLRDVSCHQTWLCERRISERRQKTRWQGVPCPCGDTHSMALSAVPDAGATIAIVLCRRAMPTTCSAGTTAAHTSLPPSAGSACVREQPSKLLLWEAVLALHARCCQQSCCSLFQCRGRRWKRLSIPIHYMLRPDTAK